MKNNTLLWDDPAFRKWFVSDLNPDIDPEKISVNDTKTILRYRTDKGEIKEVTPYNLSHQKGFCKFQTYRYTNTELCKDDPRFREWFDTCLTKPLLRQ